MKLVLFDDTGKVLDTIENEESFTVLDKENITWSSGSLRGIKSKFTILNDYEIFNFDETLENEKNLKINEISKQCESTILGKFIANVDGIDYYFSNDSEAQINFDKADRSFDKGRITSVTWTAYNIIGEVVRLVLDSIKFEPVYLSHLAHINDNISKFRDVLQPQVQNATTLAEIEAVTWEEG